MDWTGRIVVHWDRIKEPLSWKKRKRIAAGLMGDAFHEDMPQNAIDQAMATVAAAHWHDFMFLTKRPGAAMTYLNRANLSRTIVRILGKDCRIWPPQNALIGATVENQAAADFSLPYMRAIAEAGWRTFISYEPAIGPVDWRPWTFTKWLIAGGEKGPRAPHPDWLRAARDFCQKHGIPFHFKQWGRWYPMDRGACSHPSSHGIEHTKGLDLDRITVCDVCGMMHGYEIGGNREKTVSQLNLINKIRTETAPFDYGRTPTRKVKESLREAGFSPGHRKLDGVEYLEFPK
jgi:protein gp37